MNLNQDDIKLLIQCVETYPEYKWRMQTATAAIEEMNHLFSGDHSEEEHQNFQKEAEKKEREFRIAQNKLCDDLVLIKAKLIQLRNKLDSEAADRILNDAKVYKT